MSAKSTLYYAQSECLETLISEYGDRLESLTADHKLHLIAVLAVWLSEDDFDLQDATRTITTVPETGQVQDAIDILDGDIKPNDAQGLMAALVEQIRSGVYQQ